MDSISLNPGQDNPDIILVAGNMLEKLNAGHIGHTLIRDDYMDIVFGNNINSFCLRFLQ